MATKSYLLPCTPTTSSLSTETSSLFRNPSGFHFHIPKFKFCSSKITTALNLNDPEAKRSVKTRKLGYFSGAETSSEIGRLFSSLSTDSVSDCRQIHGLAVKLNAFVIGDLIGNKLVRLYSRSEGLLGNARKLFDEIPNRTMPGYAALITAFCRLERWEDLFLVLGLMVDGGLLPDKYVVPTVLKACSALKMSKTGKMIHSFVVRMGLDSDVFVGNSLINLYASNGDLRSSRCVFETMKEKDAVSWTTLVLGYMNAGVLDEVIEVFHSMQLYGVEPYKYVVPMVLKACSALKMMRSGKMIHGFVVRKGLDMDVVVGNSLIDLYASCGDLRSSRCVFESMREKDVVSWTNLVSGYMNAGVLDEATEVFSSMQLNGVKPDLISWNALVSGFALNGEVDLALHYLGEMQEKGVRPRVNSWNGIISGCVQNKYFVDALDVFCSMLRFPEDPNFITIASILPACAGVRNLDLGKEFHGFSIRHRLFSNAHVEGSLIDMYTKCGRSDYAERVFAMSENKNTAMWNEMIAAFVNEEKMAEALERLKSMQNDGPKPDVISFNTLFSGYARNGQKDEAYGLFSSMRQMNLKPNIASFNALVSGFQQSGLSCEALKLFQAMQSPSDGNFSEMFVESSRPNSITTTSALAACANLNSKRQGKEIHGYSLRNGFERNIYVSSALVHMYSKCHDTVSASKVFWRIEDRNTICWNALIAGHVKTTNPETALQLFCQMLSEGVKPSLITLMILLLACGDMGALRSGRELHGYILKSQVDKHDPNLAKALTSMYAKCGSSLDAESVFNSEAKDDVGLWNSATCSFSGIWKIAIKLFEKLELLGIWPHRG